MKLVAYASCRRWPLSCSAALLAAGIVHICTVFAMPLVLSHRRRIPGWHARCRCNAFVILPQARPRAQVLPFQMPDARYAICRFDVGDGAAVGEGRAGGAGLDAVGLHARRARASMRCPPSEQRRLNVSLLVLPPGDRFLGPMAELRAIDPDTSQVTAPERRGLIVIQAPMKGRTYAAEIEQSLKQATCRKLTY